MKLVAGDKYMILAIRCRRPWYRYNVQRVASSISLADLLAAVWP